jgi:hypothetical protein
MTADEVAQYDANAATQHSIDVLKEKASLQDELDQLTMTSAQLLAKQRDALDASNQALFDQVQAARDAQAQADAVSQEKASLQDELDQLTMTSAQLLAKQRDALDASNQALFDQVQAVKAQQAADAAAAAHATSVANEHAQLTTQLLQLEGDTAALRQQQLDGTFDENKALLQQIFALQDAHAAETKRTQAIKEATDAAQKARSTWHDIATGLSDEAVRIRNEMSGQMSVAAAQANFAILTARARAGDQGAAQQLVSASQQLDTVAASSYAHSATELALIRGATAASLQSTSAILDAAYGTNSNAPVVRPVANAQCAGDEAAEDDGNHRRPLARHQGEHAAGDRPRRSCSQ